ncbi:hypothetical protein [Desulfovibrio sp.]|uniref:hypothetical protein n=1 Tax=Desulfovibrio sp. TaxID=885 RepID=UPI003076AAE9
MVTLGISFLLIFFLPHCGGLKNLSGTVGETALTVEQLASRGHGINIPTEYNGEGTRYRQWVNIKSGNTSATGGSQPHTHTLAGASGASDSLPPYYALALIMRIA